MIVALISVGLLGLLVFLLGLNVSKERRSVIITQHEAEADPSSALRKAMRAHGNCCEYAPMLALMILALGLGSPVAPIWLLALMIIAVVFRFIHAGGVLMGESIYKANMGKFIGALGTYITGVALAVLLIIRGIQLL